MNDLVTADHVPDHIDMEAVRMIAIREIKQAETAYGAKSEERETLPEDFYRLGYLKGMQALHRRLVNYQYSDC